MASDVRQWFRERFTSGPRPADRYLGRWTTIAFGLLLAVLGFWLFCTLVNLWPTVDRNVQHATTQKSAHLGWGIGTLKLTKSSGLIVLVLLMGAIGGYIHATTSFATFLGNRRLKASWGWWYGLRVFMGAALALLFYFALRGSLFGSQAASQQVDPYGVAAGAGLAGLFSKQAIDKLRQLFDTAFQVPSNEGDAARADKADEARPEITGLVPSSYRVGESGTLKVEGTGFSQKAAVRVGSEQRATTFVSPKELTVAVTSEDTAQPRSLEVTVVNPDGEGGASLPAKLTVKAS